MEAKLQKLEQQFREDSDGRRQLSSIFYGVAIHVDGYTNPSADELKIIMSKHGGKYHMYYSRSKTTHVIASNLPHAKRKELRPDQKVVKPEWIVDSLKAKELLPHEDYLLIPLGNGAQNRISSLLGKRRSADSGSSRSVDANNSSSVPSTSISSLEDRPNAVDTTSVPSPAQVSSRTICPTTDSNFLSEFYSHSRLHFLSTWKTELTDYVRYLQTEESYEKIPLTGYEKLLNISKNEGGTSSSYGRAIMHVDMDCFFVSIGLLSRPELRGLPVAVTHTSGASNVRERPGVDVELEKQLYMDRYTGGKNSTLKHSDNDSVIKETKSPPKASSFSEIASCSYEARAAGVKNGMFFGKAIQLCPELRTIPYDFEAYREASDQMYSTLATYTRHIEAVSCDEALVDLTQVVKETGLTPLRIAACIRRSIKEATGCNASAGVGPNIALARMATRRAKPDGQFGVTEAEAKEFMLDIAVRDLPGVGRSTAARLQEMGLPTCNELQRFPVEKLKAEFGTKTGQKLHDMSCGIDNREVTREKERKSVSAEVNYGIRLMTEDEARKFFRNLSQEVVNRLKSAGVRGRRVTLKVMVKRPEAPTEPAKYGGHGFCDSLSRSVQITLKNMKDSVYEEDASVIYEAAWSMLTALKVNVQDLRGIGIQMTQLQSVNAPSTSTESSSAAFLKKFMTKKPEVQQGNLSTLSEQPTPADTEGTPSLEEEKAPEALNCSFLDALPPELRKEVEENLQEQKQALEANIRNNEMSTLAAQRLAQSSELTANIPKVLFSGGGRLSAIASTSGMTKGSKVARGRGRGASVPKSKTQRAKPKSGCRSPATGGSPAKLITDMFPVTYSPKKQSSVRNSPFKASPLTKPTRRSAPAEALLAKARRKLVALKEEPIEIADSDEDGQDEDHPIADEQEEVVTMDESVPSLGGATTVPELRQAIIEWTEEYKEDGPLECDVNDFISFLLRTAIEKRNLEKVFLVLKSFMRRIAALATQRKHKRDRVWMDVYSRVCEEIQSAVEKAYNGGRLPLIPL